MLDFRTLSPLLSGPPRSAPFHVGVSSGIIAATVSGLSTAIDESVTLHLHPHSRSEGLSSSFSEVPS